MKRPDSQCAPVSATISPPRVVREQICELEARSRFGHHRSHRVAPGRVMSGCLVPGRRLCIAIDLDEHKPRRITGLLHEVEAGNAGFVDALASIFDGRPLEGFDAFGLHVDMDVDDQHGGGWSNGELEFWSIAIRASRSVEHARAPFMKLLSGSMRGHSMARHRTVLPLPKGTGRSERKITVLLHSALLTRQPPASRVGSNPAAFQPRCRSCASSAL